ncbi:cell division protein SepF [Ilumatobacter sp.]|uniref:cell division protein SepF n=1 Tax=Ilumatobacter sp. TaxID=1967498 RepID=UPI003B521BEC
MSLWKKTMDYLGLGPDDAYDDYDDYDEPEAPARQSRTSREAEPQNGRGRGGWEPEPDPTVRPVAPRPSFPSRDFDASSASRRPAQSQQPPAGRTDDSGVQIRPSTSEPTSQPQLRSIQGGAMEPHTVRPRRFDQAQEVADAFKGGTPVIMNLEGTERDVARRLIDFGSGICYALDGTMEKVATGVYLLKPPASRPVRYDDYDD